MSCICWATQQTRHSYPMFDQCWPTVYDVGPTLVKHLVNVLYLPGKQFTLCFTQACGQGSTRPASKASSSTAKVSKSTSRESKLARSPSCSSRHSCRHHDDDDDDTSSSMSGSNFSYSKDETISLEKPIDQMDGPEINEVNVVFVKYPDECCPKCCLRQFPCCDMLDKTTIGQKWWTARCYMYKVVEHKYFETFIIGMILGSSLALVSEIIIF